MAHQAQQVGVALDVWHASRRHDLVTEFRPAVLKRAGVRLEEGVRVTEYATVRTASTTNYRDLWQYCLTAADGSWVTYGEETTLQDHGDAGDAKDPACSFTGEAHPDPPSFDVRRLVKQVWNAMNADVDDETSLRVWGGGRTSGSNPKLTALVEELLPDGWATSRDDRGTCRLDPAMESSS